MPQNDGPARMNWGDLIAFRAVAEELNFTRAAATLTITQPALSVRIRRLEQSLGVRLLERSTRVTTLTAAGRLLSDWVERTAQGWEQVRREMADTVTEAPEPPRRAAVRLDVSGLEPRRMLAPLVRRFARIDWSWETAPSPDRLADRLRAGEAQLGLWCRLPFSGPVDLRELETALVGRFPLAVELPAGHRLAAGAVVEVAELAGEAWVGGAGGQDRALLERACAELGGFRPRIVHTTDDRNEIRRAVAAGRAVTFAGPPAGSGPAVVRRPVRGAPECAIYLSWPSTTPAELAHRVLARLRQDAEGAAGQPGHVVQRLAHRGRTSAQRYATTS